MRLTPTVKILVILCVVAFIGQKAGDMAFDLGLLSFFGLVPSQFVLHFQFWQIFTYAFLHGDLMHIVFNLLMLVFLGSDLETLWGKKRFITFYMFCAVFAGLFYLVLVFLWKGQGMHVPMVGASGAIYGLLVAYGILYGERVMLFMMLFPMKAKHFVLVLGFFELATSVFSNQGAGLSSIAHLGGIAGGFGYLYVLTIWRMRSKRIQGQRGRPPATRKKPSSSHLKLVINNSQNKKDAQENFDDSHSGDDHDPKTWH